MDDDITVVCIFLTIALIIGFIAIPTYLYQVSESGMYQDCLNFCQYSEVKDRNICFLECNNEFEYCKNS